MNVASAHLSRGDALGDGVESPVELLHFGSHLSLAVLTPGGHELLGQIPHLVQLSPGELQLCAQHLWDPNAPQPENQPENQSENEPENQQLCINIKAAHRLHTGNENIYCRDSSFLYGTSFKIE